MLSLKKQKFLGSNKSRGFTIVELLIVIVVIAILATLVIVTFTGVQRKARDSQRQTDVNAVASHLEAFNAQYGYYPTLKDLQTTNFQTGYLKGLDPAALIDPKGTALAASTSATAYGYTAAGATGCVNTTLSDPTAADTSNNGCDSYTLTATLESGGTYVKKSN